MLTGSIMFQVDLLVLVYPVKLLSDDKIQSDATDYALPSHILMNAELYQHHEPSPQVAFGHVPDHLRQTYNLVHNQPQASRLPLIVYDRWELHY